MATLEEKIIDELKLALEYQEPTGGYAQWLMSVSLPSVIEREVTWGRFLCHLFIYN